MKKIVHISDLHFGRVDNTLLPSFIKQILDLDPDLIAVSGDLTQRARTSQFKDAQRFLKLLPFPQIVVPGNHDIPLHNVASRFFSPLNKYKKYITNDLYPTYRDEEVFALGINSARSLTIKGGRISKLQTLKIKNQFAGTPKELIKVLVTHHPFGLPDGFDRRDLIGRAHEAMSSFAGSGVDVFLSGHLHVGHTGDTVKRYNIKGYNALIIQAGTAISNRHRGEGNSFNVLRIERDTIQVERLLWNDLEGIFLTATEETFMRTDHGWKKP